MSDWMVSRSEQSDRFPLDVQSRGRALTETEQAFADALEAIFADNIHDMEAVAEALADRSIEAPVAGGTSWTLDLLQTELSAINKSLDDAFDESGYGA